jgi:hypothetical protein
VYRLETNWSCTRFRIGRAAPHGANSIVRMG